ISIVEEAFDKCLVDQNNLWRLPIVRVAEESAAFQRCLDRAKVIWRDHSNLRGRDGVVSYSFTFDREAAGIMWTNQRHGVTATDRRVAHARNPTHPLQ